MKETEDRDLLGEAMERTVLSYIVLLAFCGAAVLLLHLSSQYHLVWLKSAAACVMVLGYAFSKFTLKQVMKLRAEYPSISLFNAYRHVFFSYLQVLAFTPLVGAVVTRILVRERGRNPFLARDESDSA